MIVFKKTKKSKDKTKNKSKTYKKSSGQKMQFKRVGIET